MINDNEAHRLHRIMNQCWHH